MICHVVVRAKSKLCWLDSRGKNKPSNPFWKTKSKIQKSKNDRCAKSHSCPTTPILRFEIRSSTINHLILRIKSEEEETPTKPKQDRHIGWRCADFSLHRFPGQGPWSKYFLSNKQNQMASRLGLVRTTQWAKFVVIYTYTSATTRTILMSNDRDSSSFSHLVGKGRQSENKRRRERSRNKRKEDR